MLLTSTILGIEQRTVIIVLLIVMIIMIISMLVMNARIKYMTRKYNRLMSGKSGKSLERVILARFKEMDKVKSMSRRMSREHEDFKNKVNVCYNRLGLVKYDALGDMTGEISYAVAFLDNKLCGVVINTVHTRQGCYSYAKPVVNGKTIQRCSDEELEAIELAINSADRYGVIDNTSDGKSEDIGEFIEDILNDDMTDETNDEQEINGNNKKIVDTGHGLVDARTIDSRSTASKSVSKSKSTRSTKARATSKKTAASDKRKQSGNRSEAPPDEE